jgi:four helix bundle protein
MENSRPNIILDKTIKFSLDIIRYCEILESERKFVIAKQLLKSGTSIGANTFEAQNAESKNDFIHKLKNCCKRN